MVEHTADSPGDNNRSMHKHTHAQCPDRTEKPHIPTNQMKTSTCTDPGPAPIRPPSPPLESPLPTASGIGNTKSEIVGPAQLHTLSAEGGPIDNPSHPLRNNLREGNTNNGTAVTNTNGDDCDDRNGMLNTLQRRLSAAETEAARHVHIIASMHSWAAQTTTSLRQIQEKCDAAEIRALSAEKEVECLRHQLTQVAAQVEAMSMDVEQRSPRNHYHRHVNANENGGGGGKRKRHAGNAAAASAAAAAAAAAAATTTNNINNGRGLVRVGTHGSLAAASQGHMDEAPPLPPLNNRDPTLAEGSDQNITT